MKAFKIYICDRINPGGGNHEITVNSRGEFSLPPIKNGVLFDGSSPDDAHSASGEIIMKRAQSELDAVRMVIESISPQFMVQAIEVDEQGNGGLQDIICPGCGCDVKINKKALSFNCQHCGREYERNLRFKGPADFLARLIADGPGINTPVILSKFIDFLFNDCSSRQESALIPEEVAGIFEDSNQPHWLQRSLESGKIIEDEQSKIDLAEESLVKIVVPANPGSSGNNSGRADREDSSRKGDIEYHCQFIQRQGAVLWDIILPGQISISPLIESNKGMLEGRWSGLFFYGPLKEINYRFLIEYIVRNDGLDPLELKKFAPSFRKIYPQKLRRRMYWIKIRCIEKLVRPMNLKQFLKRSDGRPFRTTYLRNFTIVVPAGDM